MNIPLNIDWQQILLHLANFVLLAGGLTLLLYKPVKKFMDQRSENYEKMNREAAEKLKAAEETKAAYEAQLAQAEAEISEKRAQVAKETAEAAEEELRKAREKAQDITDKAWKKAQEERQKLLTETRQEITSLAVKAARKVLVSQEETYDQFLKEAEADESRDEAHE